MNYTIVFNLAYNEAAAKYLPTAYIAELTDKGLGYMKAILNNMTLGSYKLDDFNKGHKKAIEIVYELAPERILEKYHPKGRKKFSLQQIFEDKEKSTLINLYLDRKIDKWLQIIQQNNFPLCLELQRKVKLETIRIKVLDAELEPSLFFKKTNSGIEYQLKLRYEDRNIYCNQHDVHICTDTPSWVVIDYILLRVKHINSAKLKPFLTKSSLLIPPSSIKVYFEKFILQMATMLEVQTQGFEVQTSNEIQDVKLKVNTNFIKDQYIIEMVFDYGEASFAYQQPGRYRSRLHISENDQIDIIKIERSEIEEEYVSKLMSLGLKPTASKYFELAQQAEDTYEIIYWLSENYNSLIDSGFTVPEPKIQNRFVNLEHSEVNVNFDDSIDWFDIRGFLQVGEFEIPFIDFLENIKNENRFFLLPNGEFFIIPETWMAKYSGLSKFAEKTSTGCRVQRSHYTLLEELKEDEILPETIIVEEIDFEYVPSHHLKAELRPYQLEGVKWLIKHQKNKLGACLADDMGLGKTLQTIALLNYVKDNLEVEEVLIAEKGQLDLFGSTEVYEEGPLRAIIILPSSLIFNWYDEINKFSPRLKAVKYVGNQRNQIESKLEVFDIVLTTYGIARMDIARLNKINWQYVILDESHLIKNRDSQSFKALATLQAENKMTLTGTPIENSLSDLWSQMEFINPNILGDFPFFNRHFKIPIEKHRDEAALNELKSLVDPFILRRRKKDVAHDLPELMQHIEYVEMSEEQAQIYTDQKNAIRNQLLSLDSHSSEYNMHVLAALLKLRQIANNPILSDKDYEGLSGKFEIIKSKLENIFKSEQKVLVFSTFTSHLQLIENYLIQEGRKFVKLTGKSNVKSREKSVKLFQNDNDYNVFLISLKAGGVGLNLTKADFVFILDPWWNPFTEEQAIARAHRIGKKNPVTVMRFISKDTIEEKIIKLQAKKTVLSADVLESEELAHFTREELRDLLN